MASEIVRAAPFHSLLHYQSWYDLQRDVREGDNYVQFSEENVKQQVHGVICFGNSLGNFSSDVYIALKRLDIELDGFLLDDGWDDWNTLWGVNTLVKVIPCTSQL